MKLIGISLMKRELDLERHRVHFESQLFYSRETSVKILEALIFLFAKWGELYLAFLLHGIFM